MATIPGVLIFGGVNAHGGRAGNAPDVYSTSSKVSSGLAGAQFFDHELMRIIPDGSDAEPTATSLSWWPWFDENLGTIYTVASATSTTVTVTPDPGWTTDEFSSSTVTTSSSNAGFDNFKTAVSSNSSATLTVASWDVTPSAGHKLWLNQGRFSDYHAVTGFRSSGESSSAATRGGGAVRQDGVGIGYDAGLVRELWQNVYTAAPYFVAAKYTSTSSTDAFAAAGSARTAFETWLAKLEAAFALRYPSDTLAWSYVLLDQVYEDVDAWIAEHPTTTKRDAYRTNLEALIAYLRGASVLNNSTARFFLSDHSATLRAADETAAVGSSSASYRRGVHADVALADSNVRAIDFDGAGFSTRGATQQAYSRDADQEFYAQSVYWRGGAELISRRIEQWEAGTPTAADGVLPVYLLIGDSFEVGSITSAYSSALDSGSLVDYVRDERERIWNRTNQALEAYNAHDNSQTSGSTSSTSLAGPEFSLMGSLRALHPQTGFALVKRAGKTSALATQYAAYGANEDGGVWLKSTTGEHWDALADDVAGAYQAANVQLGKQVQLRGIFVGLGTNDAATEGGGAAFASALGGFVRVLRARFGTVVDGKQVPIIWRLPQLGVADRLYEELVTIRTALRDYASSDGQFIAQNVDDLERGSDNLNETPAATVKRGRRISTNLATIALPNCDA